MKFQQNAFIRKTVKKRHMKKIFSFSSNQKVRSETWDPGRLQVGPQDPKLGPPKCLGRTRNLGPGTQTPKMSRWYHRPRTRKTTPGTQDTKMLKWDSRLRTQ